MAGHIDQIRQRYDEFGQGDIESALQDWADDVVWQARILRSCRAAVSTTARRRR